MGRLPDLFFTKTIKENLNINRKASKLFPFAYLLLTVVPLALTSVSIIQKFAVYNLILLIALTVFSVFTGVIRRKLLINRRLFSK